MIVEWRGSSGAIHTPLKSRQPSTSATRLSGSPGSGEGNDRWILALRQTVSRAPSDHFVSPASALDRGCPPPRESNRQLKPGLVLARLSYLPGFVPANFQNVRCL